MIESFQIVNKIMTLSTDKQPEQKSQGSQDPLLILKRRFARGEITEEEYQRMRKILED
jgi:uncharacterized membrane protein